MKGNIAQGANYLMRGAKLLGHPSLRLFVAIPLTLNIVIFATLISLGFGYLSEMMDSMLARIPGWLSFIQWIQKGD